jgi:ABC-type antimicrobial peptide transport system permease subunit
VVGHGLRLAGLGVLLGLAAALAVGPRVRELLFEVSPGDPLVLALAAVVLLAVAALASVVPGVRATRADPMLALRSE